MTLASLKLCTVRSIRQQLPPWLPAFRQSCQIAKEAPLTCSKLSICWKPRQVSCIESFTSFDFGPKARSGKGYTGQDPKFLPWKANSSLVAKEQPDKEHLNSRFCPQNATKLPTEAEARLPYLRGRTCGALFWGSQGERSGEESTSRAVAVCPESHCAGQGPVVYTLWLSQFWRNSGTGICLCRRCRS